MKQEPLFHSEVGYPHMLTADLVTRTFSHQEAMSLGQAGP